MAEKKIAVVEDFLTCPVCLETFKEPVSLGCNHSFCSSCLWNQWDQNNTRDCPLCSRRSSKDLNALPVNFALKELSISFSMNEKSGQQTEKEVVCIKHPEVLPLFCLDEEQVLCPVCEFSLHRDHEVVPVETAVSELKEQLRSELQPLLKKKGRVQLVKRETEEICEHSENQVESCERQIRAVFDRLHQFLDEEEESQLAALREEQQRQAQTMGPELDRIRKQLSSLTQSISTVEDQLQKDHMDFLREYRQTQKTARTLISNPNPKLVPGLLINQAKVLGNMGFRVWEKMRGMVHNSPVILDPNTANEWLYLSEDLTTVTRAHQRLPLNPERFTKYPIVLGSNGFSSGKHQWDVEVGDHPDWIIGVAKESVVREGDKGAIPEHEYWCLDLSSGEYSDVVGKKLKLKRSPQKIQVQLDYDKGKVSFYNADNMSLICSYKDTFREKLFPYFSVGSSDDAKTKTITIQ